MSLPMRNLGSNLLPLWVPFLLSPSRHIAAGLILMNYIVSPFHAGGVHLHSSPIWIFSIGSNWRALYDYICSLDIDSHPPPPLPHPHPPQLLQLELCHFCVSLGVHAPTHATRPRAAALSSAGATSCADGAHCFHSMRVCLYLAPTLYAGCGHVTVHALVYI